MTQALMLSVFPGFVAGGAQMRFVRIANALGPRVRHAIVALDGRTDCRALLHPALDVRLLPAPAGSRPVAARLRDIARLVARERPDTLLTHNWGSIEWSVANMLGPRVPHLHAEDGFNPDERVRQKRRRVWARRLALARSRVIVPSATLAAIARDAWRLPPGRIAHVPNGVDLARFRPGPAGAADGRAAMAAAWKLAPGGVVVGTVAGLRGEKNVARLVDAVARAAGTGVAGKRSAGQGADLRLVVAGEGAERAGLEALAARLLPPGHACFLGAVADPAPLYRGLDIFALSSDTEQMPLSLLEAMASGVAAVATDVGDVRAMLHGGDPAWVTPPDAGRLGAAIAALASDPARRLAAGRANRAIAERRYGEEAMLEAWSRLIDHPARVA